MVRIVAVVAELEPLLENGVVQGGACGRNHHAVLVERRHGEGTLLGVPERSVSEGVRGYEDVGGHPVARVLARGGDVYPYRQRGVADDLEVGVEGVEGLLEDLRCAAFVLPHYEFDWARKGGQRWVRGHDGGVVPVCDLSHEDAGEGADGEGEVGVAGEVVDGHHGTGHRGVHLQGGHQRIVRGGEDGIRTYKVGV